MLLCQTLLYCPSNLRLACNLKYTYQHTFQFPPILCVEKMHICTYLGEFNQFLGLQIIFIYEGLLAVEINSGIYVIFKSVLLHQIGPAE